MFAPAHRAPAEVQVVVDSVLLDLSSSFYLTCLACLPCLLPSRQGAAARCDLCAW
jgi:hypothetical protein